MRGQYGQGSVGGKKVPGYCEEDGVSPDSQTETFVALRMFLDVSRWQNVSFYLRTGKRLTQRASEIAIQFRSVPHQSFAPEATLDWQPSRRRCPSTRTKVLCCDFRLNTLGPKCTCGRWR
ncbi:MAG: hypothetical protein ABI604_20515 [Nitrospirota bacterium]